MSKEINRVAIVGCGNISGSIDDDAKKRHIYSHARAISEIKQLKLTACCDTDDARLKKFAERWGIPGQYLDLSDMLQKEPIDILVVATPTKFHYENVILALSSHVKVIFCEKPLTFELERGIEMAQRAEEANKILLVNYMRRWDKFYAESRNILESGDLGTIETIVTYAGTSLYMSASHMLDMIIYFGGDVSSCLGYIDRVNMARIVHGEKDFGGIALFKHKNGITSFLKATGESRQHHFFEMDFQCTRGRLRMLDDDIKYEVYKFKESPQRKELYELDLVCTKVNDNKSERVVDAYLDILDCMRKNEAPKFSVRDALKSLELISLIYKSDAIGNQTVYSQL